MYPCNIADFGILHFAKNICAALCFLAKWLFSFPMVWISNSSITGTKAWNEGRSNVLWSVRKRMLMWHYLHAIIRKVLKTTTSVNKLFAIFGHSPKKLNYSSGKHFGGLFIFFLFFFAKHEDYCSDIFIFRITNYKHVIIINNRFFSFL